MDETSLNTLLSEIRAEFQIPPFTKDQEIKNYIKEGEAFLLHLVPGADVDKDLKYRMLLKNYVNYAYYHRINEWHINYASLILSWQLGREV